MNHCTAQLANEGHAKGRRSEELTGISSLISREVLPGKQEN
jgi:hypothetical protein